MIRRLIILLLIVGCVFGDTIAYKHFIGLNDMYSGVKYLGIKDNKVYYLEHNVIYSINCNKVFKIINSYGTTIDIDCSSNTYTPRILTELDAKKNPIQFLGGGCILMGGYLLHDNVDTEIQTEADLDDWKAQQKLGYGLIAFGGILVAVGNPL